jgi:hypothetical protein
VIKFRECARSNITVSGRGVTSQKTSVFEYNHHRDFRTELILSHQDHSVLYWSGCVVAISFPTAMLGINGQAIWLPCGYLLQCTDYWPDGMFPMWLLTALHRELVMRYGCHVITAVNRVLARRYGCHEITLTAMHRVLVRQYGCHVITYCNSQSIGQAI